MVTGLVTALGFVLDYTGGSWLNISSNDWGLIGLISFVVFVALTVGREVDWAGQQKPDIIVRPEVHGDRALLVVTNTGGAANFTAKARVRAAIPEPELYTMCWESVPAMNCPIDGDGGTASITVAGKSKSDHIIPGDVTTSFFKGSLILFKMVASGVEAFPAVSGKTRQTIVDDDEVTEYTFMERCIVEVTITATPKLKRKWGTRKYLCEIENEQIKLCETELSVPHKSL